MKPIYAFFLVLFSQCSFSETADKPPVPYFDDGACLFECCTYRKWDVVKPTVLYAEHDTNSGVVGRVPGGVSVEGLTGTVETYRPGKIEVVKDDHGYKPGDVLWVYTNLGEGEWKIWFNGEFTAAATYFVGHGNGSVYASCVEDSSCWGRVERNPESRWWVKIRTQEGLEGWSNKPENFGNVDACG